VVGRTRGTSDLPNLVRAAYGPGWALAGDAGLVMDPITGLGIGHALRDAELLSSAIVSGLAGSRHLNGSMKRYQKQRNHQTKAAFNWTLDVAGLRGVNEIEEGLFRTSAQTKRRHHSSSACSPGSFPCGRSSVLRT
jgi:flavin-dependent dehydrogenase